MWYLRIINSKYYKSLGLKVTSEQINGQNVNVITTQMKSSSSQLKAFPDCVSDGLISFSFCLQQGIFLSLWPALAYCGVPFPGVSCYCRHWSAICKADFKIWGGVLFESFVSLDTGQLAPLLQLLSLFCAPTQSNSSCCIWEVSFTSMK